MLSPVKTLDVVVMVDIGEYMAPLISGIVVALSSWLPTSPEGYSLVRFLSAHYTSYGDYMVPAYLGVTFAVLFYFKERIALGSQNALRRSFDPGIKYFVYAAIFTILLGYPLLTGLSDLAGSKVSDFINALVGFMIFLLGLFLGRFHPVLERVEGKMREEKDEPTLIDSISSGLLQGVSLLGGLSRSGFVLLSLLFSGLSVKKALELSFMIAPVYFVMKLAFMEGWDPALPVSLLFTSFLAAFVGSILTMKGLLKLVDLLGERLFLMVFGLIAVAVYLVGVIL